MPRSRSPSPLQRLLVPSALALACATGAVERPADVPPGAAVAASRGRAGATGAADVGGTAAAPGAEASAAAAASDAGASAEEQAPAAPPSCALPADAPAGAVLLPLAAAPEPEPLPSLRLPGDVHPQHAALSLVLDPAQPRLSGSAAIGLLLDRPRSVIWLHGRGLHVTAATLDTPSARLPAAWEQVDDDGLAKVTLPCRVQGRAALHLSWDAAWDPQLNGIYLSHEAGEGYVYSQFESTGARRAFPSFDDPLFKIPWDVEVTARAGDVVIANTPQIAEEPAPAGRKRVRFATTPPLPSYLLAFAVGPFDVVVPPPLPPSEVRKRPLPVRGIAPKGRGPELAFALQAAGELTLWLEQWFGIEFPYPKLDHIAVPDFTAGAMENAGAITYREGSLLWTEGKSSPDVQSWIAGTIAHEVAHQWFGDLVTLRWWTDTWLNESFASWMDAKAEQAWRPAFRASLAALGQAHRAMSEDGLASARAIRKPVAKTSEIDNQFDTLTYQKGQAVLSMFERWVGEEKFREGVRSYLRAHAHGGGSSDDLLEALSAAAGKDVATPFRTFLEQPGVPLVRAELVCKGRRPRLLLAQQRWLPAGAKAANGPAQRWQIPVCVRAGSGREVQEACTLLGEATGAIELGGSRCPDWVMPNAGADGYYRWTLDLASLQRLTAALPRLPVRERVSFSGAVSAAWQAASLPAAEVLAAAAALARDDDGAVADAPMEILRDARLHAVAPAQRPALEAWARGLYRPALQRLGWSSPAGEEPRLRRQRTQLISFLAETARDPEVLAEAARRGRAYANAGGPGFALDAVGPELAAEALAAAVEEGDEQVFAALDGRLASTTDSGLRGRMLRALGAARDPKLAARALQLSLDQRLRRNERSGVVAALLHRPETHEQAFAFLQASWDALLPLIPEANGSELAAAAIASTCDAARAEAAYASLAPRAARLPGAELDLTQALEEARLCAARAAAHRKGAGEFLARQGKLPKAR